MNMLLGGGLFIVFLLALGVSTAVSPDLMESTAKEATV